MTRTVPCPKCGGSGLVWHGTSSKRRGRVNEDHAPCMAAFACPICPDDGSGNSKGTGRVSVANRTTAGAS